MPPAARVVVRIAASTPKKSPKKSLTMTVRQRLILILILTLQQRVPFLSHILSLSHGTCSREISGRRSCFLSTSAAALFYPVCFAHLFPVSLGLAPLRLASESYSSSHQRPRLDELWATLTPRRGPPASPPEQFSLLICLCQRQNFPAVIKC